MLEAVRRSHKKHLKNTAVIFRMTMKNILKTKRTYLLGLIAASPVLISLIYIAIKASGHTNITGYSYFAYLMGTLQIRGVLLMLAVFYGSTVFSDEVDRKTLIYLQSKPVSQVALIFGKYAAAFTLTAIFVIISTTLSYIILMLSDRRTAILDNIDILSLDILVMLLGSAVYTAMMLMLSLILKKPVLWGLAFTMLWENTVVNIPALINKFTLLHWLQSIFPHPTGTNKFLSLLNPSPSPTDTSLLVLIITTVVFIFLSWWIYMHREYKLN